MPRAFKFGFAVTVLISIVVILWLWQRDLSDASPTADSRVVQPNEHTGAEIPGLESSIKAKAGRSSIQMEPAFETGASPPARYVLGGKVQSEQLEPLPGAAVELYSQSGLSGGLHRLPVGAWPDHLESATCDNEGRYVVDIQYSVPDPVVVVRKAGFATILDYPRLGSSGSLTKDYRLPQAPCCVTGKVSDERGRAVADASVSASVVQTGSLVDRSLIYQTTNTDGGGEFRIDGLTEGRINLCRRTQEVPVIRNFVLNVINWDGGLPHARIAHNRDPTHVLAGGSTGASLQILTKAGETSIVRLGAKIGPIRPNASFHGIRSTTKQVTDNGCKGIDTNR